MSRARAAIMTTVALLVIPSACASSSTAADCLRSHNAEICADGKGGSVTIRASGLAPGSALTLETASLRPRSYEVGRDGRPAGAIGFLSASTTGTPAIRVTGRAADGTRLTGTLSPSR